MVAKILSRLALLIVLAVLLIFTSYLLAEEPAAQFNPTAQVTLEFYGTVQTANQFALAINGQVIALNGTQINTPLTPGTVVRVQAILLPDGTINAQNVSAVPVGVLPGIVEFTGVLESIGDASIVVSGQIISIGEFVDTSAFEIGTLVRLYVVSEAQGIWTLRGIIPSDQIPPRATPDPSAPITTPDAPAPVVTQEVRSGVVQPLTTPEVGNDNDHDDNSGHGNGDNDNDHGGADNDDD